MAEDEVQGVLRKAADHANTRVVHAADVATDVLRKAVVDGDLSPGQLLREAVIAQELGISRTPVRTALQRLSAEGLVDLVPGRIAQVKEYSERDIAEMYDVRAVLEGHSAYLAAQRASPEEIRELEESCRRFDALASAARDDFDDLVTENAVFHSTVWSAADNRRLTTYTNEVIAVPLVYKAYYWYSNEHRKRSAQDHRDVLGAISAEDPDRARRRMHEHVSSAGKLLLENWTAVRSA